MKDSVPSAAGETRILVVNNEAGQRLAAVVLEVLRRARQDIEAL